MEPYLVSCRHRKPLLLGDLIAIFAVFCHPKKPGGFRVTKILHPEFDIFRQLLLLETSEGLIRMSTFPEFENAGGGGFHLLGIF